MNLNPNVAWSHDVSGYSPGPRSNFEEGRKAVSLGLDAESTNTYTASLAYTNFFDGKYTTVDNQDFVALSFGVNSSTVFSGRTHVSKITKVCSTPCSRAFAAGDQCHGGGPGSRGGAN